MESSSSSDRSAGAENSESGEDRRYLTYLVRLWQDGKDRPWRASAESIQNRLRVSFAEPTQLFAYLKTQIELETRTEITESKENNGQDRP